MGMGINQMGMGINQMGMGISQMGIWVLARWGAGLSHDGVKYGYQPKGGLNFARQGV